MQPIFLIGPPASGKTTLGRALARATGREFIDLDLYIEQRFHATVAQLFATLGEDGFRTLEHNMLHEVAEIYDLIIACGGGTPCFFDNMEYMNSRGLTVRLTATEERLADRLQRAGARRPMFAQLTREEIMANSRRLSEEREPFYSQAAMTFCGDELEDRRQIDRSVKRFLSLVPSLTDKEPSPAHQPEIHTQSPHKP